MMAITPVNSMSHLFGILGVLQINLHFFSDMETMAGGGDITPAHYRMLKSILVALMERFSF